MAIYDHKYGELAYFRVYRTWGGKEYQEYVRIQDDRELAHTKAKAIDDALALKQKQHTLEQVQLPAYHIRDDGSIRGLRRITVSRAGRTPVEVFELRINVPWEKRVKRTTISLAIHGEQTGFDLAINKICEWYGLADDLSIRDELLAQRPKYLKKAQGASLADSAIQKAKDEIASLTGGFVKSFKRFTSSAEKG